MLYRLILILLLQFTVATMQPVEAASNKSEQGNKSRVISKKSAINVAKSEVRGKVLSAKKIKSKGPTVYRIKMLIGESRVRTVFVDGLTGKVIRIN
ncbi:MAG: hypothetical protein COA74_03825 [Gammaproteobacteria bacterium]|nr:MAG: hypothetical protein COA74_03825 [Gammaproteobacteria bacterium]